MTVTPTKQRFTFEEYLTYDDPTDNRYELVNGELVLMTPPTGRHARIARFLFKQFDTQIENQSYPWVACYGDVGVRTTENKSRLPDLVVITQEQEQAILDVSAVLQSPPLLIVEIVSSGNPETDYRYKRSEYAAREIPEYWIVDTRESKVTVLLLFEGLYEETVFRGSDRIIAQTFPDLTLTAEQILSA